MASTCLRLSQKAAVEEDLGTGESAQIAATLARTCCPLHERRVLAWWLTSGEVHVLYTHPPRIFDTRTNTMKQDIEVYGEVDWQNPFLVSHSAGFSSQTRRRAQRWVVTRKIIRNLSSVI